MKVLLLGTGAALHALAWKIVSAPQVEQIHCSPGNAGTALLVGTPPFSPEHETEVAQWAFSQQVDVVVIQGVAGQAEMLAGEGLSVIGAGDRGRQALSSRRGIRELLQSRRVPCVEGKTFRDLETAERYLASRRLPLWIRSDDAAQWEAIRVDERLEAFQQLARLLSLDPEVGISIEVDVAGPEVAMALLSDGQRAIPFGVSRPYDHRYEGGTGPVTEGMGAYAPYGDRTLEDLLMEKVGRPVVAALAAADLLRPAFLHLRVILSQEGPVLRDLSWGLDDLHAAVVLPLWDGDLIGVLETAARGCLEEVSPAWQSGVAVAVAVVAEGYPSSSAEGQPLPGLYDIDALVFHHATRLQVESDLPSAPITSWLQRTVQPRSVEMDGPAVTTGGRVLLVVGYAPTGGEAHRRAYEGAAQVAFPLCAWRDDIAAELG